MRVACVAPAIDPSICVCNFALVGGMTVRRCFRYASPCSAPLPPCPAHRDAQRVFHGPGCEQWTPGRPPAQVHSPAFCQPPTRPTRSWPHWPGPGRAAGPCWPQAAAELGLSSAVTHTGTQGCTETRLMGEVPDPHVVTENGALQSPACYAAVNHGLFSIWLKAAAGCARYGRGPQARPLWLKVLNLFAHTCAFSVVALQGGGQTGGQCGHEPRRHGHWPAKPPAQWHHHHRQFFSARHFQQLGQDHPQRPLRSRHRESTEATKPAASVATKDYAFVSCAVRLTCWHLAATPVVPERARAGVDLFCKARW